MTEDDRKPYKEEAKMIKQQHEKDHPDYKYRPRKKPKKIAQVLPYLTGNFQTFIAKFIFWKKSYIKINVK